MPNFQIGEYLLLNKIPTQGVVISVLIITIGTLMAGIGDLTFDLYGYTFAVLSCIAQSSYLIFLYKSGFFIFCFSVFLKRF